MNPEEKKKRSIGDLIWQIFARSFLFFAGVILVLYGLDGLVGGEVLPAAGRTISSGYTFPTKPGGSPEYLRGIPARTYGLMFVLLGLFVISLATGLAAWIQKKYFK